MDDVLSREPSPEDGTISLDTHQLDLREPRRALQMLAVHSEKLQQRLTTVQMDRENLRFQVRLLQQGHNDDQPERLRERLRHLEVENRSVGAVEGEHSQLKARIAEVERELESLEGRAPTAASATGASSTSGPSRAATDTSEEALDELRWENRLLHKRLLRLQRYSEDLQQDALRARLKSACRSRGEEPMLADRNGETAFCSAGSTSGATLEELVAGNETMLLQLRCEVRDTATALARRGQQEQVSPTGRRPAGADEEGVVDVLTLSDLAAGGDDVECHERC